MSDVADVAVRFVERSGINMEIQAELHQLQKSLIMWIHARSPDRRWPHQAPFSAGTVCSPHDLFGAQDRKSTRLNSSHQIISYAVFCLKKKKYTTNSSTTKRGTLTPRN